MARLFAGFRLATRAIPSSFFLHCDFRERRIRATVSVENLKLRFLFLCRNLLSLEGTKRLPRRLPLHLQCLITSTVIKE